MKNRFLKTLCVLCLAPLLLSGCWYEDTEEPDSGQLLVSQEQAEPQLEDAILPTGFTLPYLPDQTMDPVTCADGMQHRAERQPGQYAFTGRQVAADLPGAGR